MRRDVTALTSEHFDLAVVGSGILGACIAWDASLRGARVALIDRADFGSAASGNNLRILHGGVRHLGRLELGRARRSLREVETWLRIAPHLVSPLPVLVPAARGDGRSAWLLRLADLATGALLRPSGHQEGIGTAEFLPPDAAARRAPGAPTGSGGLLFRDALIYSPERLTLAVVKGAVQAGARAVNYVEAVSADRRGDRIEAVLFEDRRSGGEGALRADVVVNACGGEALAVQTRLTGRPPPVGPGFSYSLNLLLDRPGGETALAVGRGRLLLFVPWRGSLTVGTAHHPVGERPDREAATDAFLRRVNEAWWGNPISRDEVRVVQGGWVGAARGKDGAPRLARDIVWVEPPGQGVANLLGVATPKYTTARDVAERVVSVAAELAGRRPGRCATASMRLPEAPRGDEIELHADLRARFGDLVDPDVLEHTARSYGTAAADVLTLAHRTPRGAERVVPGEPVVRAHLVYGAASEMAVTPEDLVWRRTELGPRGFDGPDVRRLATEALGAASTGPVATRSAHD